jgi:hypothetical protein
MKPALLTAFVVFIGLTVLVFAQDGESGVGDELLNLVAAAAAGIAVFYGVTEPGGRGRRTGLAVAAAGVAIILAVVALRTAS